MFDNVKRFDSNEGNVWKYVFTKEDAVAEAVLYRYGSFEERTVICCSVMSGCPVGCSFCGTGKKFIRNLTAEEIVSQIKHILNDMNITNINSSGKKFQIMFMSMGEPMLNWNNVAQAIRVMYYSMSMRNAQYLISTMGVDHAITFGNMISLSQEIPNIGLQFSIHESYDYARDNLIPYKNKMDLCTIRDAGIAWWHATGRKVFLNYCVKTSNSTTADVQRLNTLFSSLIFNFTLSVICTPVETLKDIWDRDLDMVCTFANDLSALGHDTRVFDPAGQDDIGGGCGQLWYVQKWMEEHKA
ncbi:MAG: rRNA methyltransferase [Bacteroidota bacterium]|nr:rRNA methyltransferase [Bacteroidota bacterium]